MSGSARGAGATALVLVAATLGYPTPADRPLDHLEYALTSEALVMIPSENQQWLDLAKSLYLEPSGFPDGGATTFLQVPETPDLNASMSGTEAILLHAIEQRWDSGDFNAGDPLYVFGYSQSAVAAGMIEQQLRDDGIPSDSLHFVLVGDSAAGDGGGFLNQAMGTLLQYFPASWHDSVASLVHEVLGWYRADSAIGATTPNDLYPTDVYTLSGDGFANWDGGRHVGGMFWDHLAYLGLTPDEIAGATQQTLGQTVYHTIDSADVNMFAALANSFEMIISPFI